MQPEQTYPSVAIDLRYQYVKPVVQLSKVVPESEVIVATLLIMNRIEEPYPTEVEAIAKKLRQEGFM